MKYLRVKDLIEKLQLFDGNLPLIITRKGNGDQAGITKKGIFLVDSAYFGNDPDADEAYGVCEAYLNIGNI